MMAAVGSAISQPLMSTLLGCGMSWRTLFPLFSILGVIWVVVWFWWFRDNPHDHSSVNEAELVQIGCAPPSSSHSSVPWRHLLGSRNVLALCLLCGSWLYGWYFWLLWLPSYLLRAHNFDLKQAGWLSMFPLLCSAAGMFLGGWLSDVFSRKWGPAKGRRAPGLMFLPLSVVTIIAAVLTPQPMMVALLLSLAAGFAAMGITPIFAVCLEIGGKHAGVVSGTMNMIGNLFGMLTSLVVGWCLHYSPSQGWNIALFIIAGFYLVAAAGWLFIDPTIRIEGATESAVSTEMIKEEPLST